MPGVAQRRTKLGGTWYDRGAPVPDELVNARSINMGLVAVSSPASGSRSAGDDLAAELESTKAQLAAALARLEEAGISIDGGEDAQPFDPGEHTIDDVQAHLDATPDDLGRVLDAELGGKARKTLLDDLQRRQDDAESASDRTDTGGNAGGE